MIKRLTALLLLLTVLTSFTDHKQLTWMAIGDSITWLNGRPEVTKNRISIGYMDDVVKKLPYIHFENHGYPGWTAKAMADNINNIGIKKADLYTVFLGTNDWWTALPIGTWDDYQNNTGSKTVYGSYRIIIDKIRSLNNDAVIILMTPLQRTEYTDLNNPKVVIPGDYAANKDSVFLYQYADAVKAIAKAENLQLADLYYKSGITPKNAVHFRRLRDPQTHEYKNYTYPEYTKIPYDPSNNDYPYPVDAMYMTFDGLHPSDKGHERIAEMLIKIMKKY